MSSVHEDFNDPDRSRRGQFFQRLAHMLPTVVVLAVVNDLVWVAGLDRWLPSVPLLIVSAAISGLTVVGVMVAFVHIGYGSMCLRCMQNAPSNPARVERGRIRWWLKFDHFVAARKWLILIMIVLLIFGTFVLGKVIANPEVVSWIGFAIDLVWLSWIYAAWPHHRYRPWCPWCRRWDEGGEHECTPDPVDVGEKVA